MSLVLHRMKTDVTTPCTASINQGTENTKVAKSLNFIPVNKCDIKVANAAFVKLNEASVNQKV